MKILDQAVLSAAEARPSVTEWECSMEDWLTAGHPGAARVYLVRDGNVELRPSRDCPQGEIRPREAAPQLPNCEACEPKHADARQIVADLRERLEFCRAGNATLTECGADTARKLGAARRELADEKETSARLQRERDNADEVNAKLRGDVERLEGERVAVERERDAYKKAKAENDERFMIERDEARSQRDDAQRKLSECRAAYFRQQVEFSEGRPPAARPRCVGVYRSTACPADPRQCELLAPHDGDCGPVKELGRDDCAPKAQANQKCEWCSTRKNGSRCCGEELRQRNGELSENIIRLNGALRTAEERIAEVQGCNITLRTDLKSAMTCSAVTNGPLGPIRCERLRGDDHGQKHAGGGREWEDDFSGPEFDCDECKAKDAEIARMGAMMAKTQVRSAAQSITVGLPCRDIDFPLYEVSIDGVYWCRIPPRNVYRTGEGGYRFQRTTVKL